MKCCHKAFDCEPHIELLQSPNHYDVELSETGFCCGGIRNPCTTPGCTECGTHYQPIESAASSHRPWCLPSLARCTESKARTTCEVCRRRLGLDLLPTCTRLPPYAGCEITFTMLLLRLSECARCTAFETIPTQATTSIVIESEGCALVANQDASVEAYRAGQLIAKGTWGRKGLRGLFGVVSGIQPCPQTLIDALNDKINFLEEGPIENDLNKCPDCGSDILEALGVVGGGMGIWVMCAAKGLCGFSKLLSPAEARDAEHNC